jgi:hypothetical protein
VVKECVDRYSEFISLHCTRGITSCPWSLSVEPSFPFLSVRVCIIFDSGDHNDNSKPQTLNLAFNLDVAVDFTGIVGSRTGLTTGFGGNTNVHSSGLMGCPRQQKMPSTTTITRTAPKITPPTNSPRLAAFVFVGSTMPPNVRAIEIALRHFKRH